MNAFSVRRVAAVDPATLAALAEVLLDVVDGGASVGFLAPLPRDRALAFWTRVATGVAGGQRALFVAADAHGICGTVQLLLDLPDNQPHRTDLSKMLVHRRARCRGIAASLLAAAEAAARELGRTLLVLDTVTGSAAARVYERAGWVRAGDIPRYALFPDGRECSTTVYYRDLGSEPGRSG
jgi:GNAT superfamily N-acetyltransferase